MLQPGRRRRNGIAHDGLLRVLVYSMDYNINLGTAGWGVWHSPDAGKSWVRHRAPFPLNSRIQALVPLPGESRGLLAAGDTGRFGSDDGGASWARIGAAGDLPTIWSLAVDPADPRTLFAGTRPAAVYRSRDGGWRWERLDVAVATECSIGKPFVTRVLVDPDDRRIVWARRRDRRRLPQPRRRRHLDEGRPRAERSRRPRHGHRAHQPPTRVREHERRGVLERRSRRDVDADRGEDPVAVAVRARHRGEARRSARPVRRVRRDHNWRNGRRAPLERWRANLAEPTPARPAQRHRVGPRDASRRRCPDRGLESVRRGLRQRGRRRVLAQDRPRVRRDPHRSLAAGVIRPTRS